MSDEARHISYRTRGQRVAGYVCLGLGVACGVVSLVAHWLFAGADPGGIVALRIASGLVAAAFLFPGLVLAFKAIEVVVDPARGVLGIGWTWLRWRRMSVYPVERDAVIHLDAIEVTGGQTSTTHYPVSYVHSGGAAPIVRGADYRVSRRRAEDLARSLGLSLVDSTSGSEVVRGPDALDRSAADPATLPEGLAWPHLPKGARLRARYEVDTLSVTIPPPGPCSVTWLGLFLFGFGGLLAWVLVELATSGIHRVLGILLGLLLFGLTALLAHAGYQALAETLWRTRRLVVSPRGIRMPRREGDGEGPFVASADVEEIDLTEGGEGVLARTDASDVELGSYLTHAEGQCLRDMVHLALAGRLPRR